MARMSADLPSDLPGDPNGDPPVTPDLLRQLEALGGQLVWRIGKDEASDDVIVRLGFASATPRFAHLSRLRSAGDAELQAALAENRVVIEWVD
ncbi:hypothetical protein GCM10008961_28690 [Deinococcus knuensis]|uniref:DUF3248 domain-containing protein n=1 Tax=Deinococcus knuensis TaxID=1837380 RepID=A0ABQ2SNM0_9DEIO|nr:hypothetical protein GCM10008961_28690 [Deinococcus knuensis]